MVAKLRQGRLNFVILTDHAEGFTEARFAEYVAQCRAYSSEELILVPGLEYTFEERYGRIEILLIGDEAFVEAKEMAQVWNHKHRKDLIAILPHPAKFKIRPAQLPSQFDLIEVWNRRYDGGFFPPRQNLSFFRAVSEHIPHVQAVSGVDYHEPGDALDLVTVVRCEHLSSSAVIKALCSGAFHTQHGDFLLPSDLQLSPIQRVYRQAVSLARNTLYRLGRWVTGYPVIRDLYSPETRRRLKQLLH